MRQYIEDRIKVLDDELLNHYPASCKAIEIKRGIYELKECLIQLNLNPYGGG